MSAPLDPSLYYLTNFHRALDWIDERYADLLDAEEARFIADFRALPLPSRALLVRLVMRKGPHFRASKLSYAEIGDIPEAAAPLLELGWLSDDYPLALDELLPLLLKDELLARFRDDLPRGSLKKAELYEHLHAYHEQVQPFDSWYPDLDRLYTLMATPLCDRLRLLFFGNLQQDWSEFVLADLGIFRYETVPFTPDSRAFRRRDELEAYIHLWNGAVRFDAGESIAELLVELGEFRSDNAYLQARHARLLYRMAYQLEREGELDAALALYQRTTAGGSRQRQIRVLERLQRFDEAHALAQAALTAPESDGELQLVERALTRLVRQLGLPKEIAAKPVPPLRIDLELPRPRRQRRIRRAIRAPRGRGASALRGERAGLQPVRPALLGRDLRPAARRLLPPLPGRAQRSVSRRFRQPPRRSLRRPPGAAGQRRLSGGDP